MKTKSKNQNPRNKNEFRYHDVIAKNNSGKSKVIAHPAYVFMEKGNIFVYVPITHSSNVKNTIVIKLRKNPNPKDTRDSYRVIDIKEDTKDRFSKRLKSWKIDPLDENDIRLEYKKR